MEIAALLEQVDLERYLPLFERHDLRREELPDLTQEDLREMGISKLGHRKRILSAIENAFQDSTGNPHQSGQRRIVTVLFTDLVGSSRLAGRLDPEELRHMVRAYQAVARDAVERYDGHVAQFMGDGILAYFGYPQSHGDDALRAARAGLDIVSAAEELAATVGQAENLPVQIRVGIEAGLVVVGDVIAEGSGRRFAIIGEAPNTASHIQTLAEPGTVLVGPKVADQIKGVMHVEAIGEKHIKGLDQPLELWRVRGRGLTSALTASHHDTQQSPFVGRTAELRALHDAMARTRAGERVCLQIVGEAGIGKSRLVSQFLASTGRMARVLACHCIPLDARAYHPFGLMLRQRAAHRASKTATSPRAALTEDIVALDDSLKSDLPYLLQVAGLANDADGIDPDMVSLRIREAIANLVRASGALIPTILFVNDAHWIDERSADTLHRMIEYTELRGVLILITSRPDADLPWQARLENLTLGPLDDGAARQLFRNCARVSEEPSADDAIARAGGNPLYIEELAMRVADTAGETTRPLSGDVPTNLSGLLLERVDRMSSSARDLVRVASAVGRRFSIELIMDPGPSRDRALAEVLDAGLVRKDDDGAHFIFKHVLVRDAVYETLLSEDRARLHLSIGKRFEDQSAVVADKPVEELARHFEAAGERSRAAHYAFRAGERALEFFALKDAAGWFERFLLLLPEDRTEGEERRRFEAQHHIIYIKCWDARFDEMVEIADQELSWLKRSGARDMVSRFLSWLGEAYLHNGQFERSAETLADALSIAEGIGDTEAEGHALAELAWLETLVGTEPQRLEQITRRLDRVAGALGGVPFFSTFSIYGRCAGAFHAGRLALARETANELRSLGDDTGYPPAKCWGACLLAYAEALFGNDRRAVELMERAKSTSACAFDDLVVLLCRGVILRHSGDAQGALQAFFDAKLNERSVGMFMFAYLAPVENGLALADLGRLSAARRELEAVAQNFEAQHNPRAHALALAALARVEQKSGGELGAVKTRLQSALQTATQLGMYGLVAEICLDLAELAERDQDGEQVRRHLDAAEDAASGLGWLKLEQRIRAAQRRHAAPEDP